MAAPFGFLKLYIFSSHSKNPRRSVDEELKTLSQLPMILEEVFSWCKHEPRTPSPALWSPEGTTNLYLRTILGII
jgi:hypothetical protein